MLSTLSRKGFIPREEMLGNIRVPGYLVLEKSASHRGDGREIYLDIIPPAHEL
jgi:hypothetical protein